VVSRDVDDVDTWNAENENEDDVKRAKIKSITNSLSILYFSPVLTTFLRAGPRYA
jgi:hypothetical protein